MMVALQCPDTVHISQGKSSRPLWFQSRSCKDSAGHYLATTLPAPQLSNTAGHSQLPPRGASAGDPVQRGSQLGGSIFQEGCILDQQPPFPQEASRASEKPAINPFIDEVYGLDVAHLQRQADHE